jgi:branched-chain amino acid transport system ATP-binding protein
VSLLQVDAIDVHYGDFQAIYGVSLSVEEGETLAIIGANGAGKSTLLKAISGLMLPSAGSIRLDGRDVTREPAYRRVAQGIALTPEGRRIFASLTVEENLLVGAHAKRPGPWDLEAVLDAIPLVREIRGKSGQTLSGGEQQATAIARALMSNPRLLLLDEVSLGLAPVAVEGVYAALPSIAARGTTVLIVEQDVKHALAVADRVQCLLEGRTVLEGRASELRREQLASAYFGL